ncbi:hypothetical protein [Novipirellula sp.]|uniref:hypothetical protein n=1 Tax=Novipirellula sp. TaxID=2795430 RepID=UPI00356AC624
METKLSKTSGVLTFLAVISIWGSPLYSQEPNSQAPKNRIHVVGPDGKYAADTIVHRFTGGKLVFMPDGKVILNGEKARRGVHGYDRLIDEGEGIQVEYPHELGGMESMGMDGGGGGEMMMGMGMGSDMGMEMGMEEMGAEESHKTPSNVLYTVPGEQDIFFATNPKNEFAFVPWTSNLVKKIQLREPATLTFSVPRHYAADRYVVLAVWTNGFVYPQFPHEQPIPLSSQKDGVPGGESFRDETGPGTADWRFHWFVSYWQVAPLTEPEEKDADGFHTASVTMPPGEVRVTLVPKERFEEVQHSVKLLNQLSLTGGPSRIVVARSGKTASTDDTPVALVENGAVDLEIHGDLTEAAMPDWSSDEQLIVLTRISDTSQKPNLTHADDYVRWANSTRDERSEYRPLGIVAHLTADGTYLAVGLLPGEYQAWKVAKSKLERGTEFRRALPIELLTAIPAGPTTNGITPLKITAKLDTPSSSNTFKLPTINQGSARQSVGDDPFAAPNTNGTKYYGKRTVGSYAPAIEPSAAARERKRRILMLAKQIQEMDRRVEVAKHMLTELMREENMIPARDPFADPFTEKADPFGGDPFGGGPAANADPFAADPFGGSSAKVDPFSSEPMQDPFAAPRSPQPPSADPFAP